MHIDIQVSGQPMDALQRAQILAHLQYRLQFVLARLSRRVVRVAVVLSDVNGPRGGKDKRCVLRVDLPQQPAVVIRQRHADWRSLIDGVVARASRSVAARLQRAKQQRRRPGEAHVALPCAPLSVGA
ncbi:MAG: hypothetical protein ACYCSR_15470 [Thiomonas sp.]